MKKALSFILAAAMAIGFASCGKEENKEEINVPIFEAKTVKYRTAKAELSEISERYVAEGSYGLPYSESVMFQASGQVDQVYVDGEKLVKKGELLCTLFSDDLETRIEEKEVYLNQAKKTLNTLLANYDGGSAFEIEQARVEVDIQQLEYDRLLKEKDLYNVYAPCDGTFRLSSQYRGGLQRYTWVNKGQRLGTATDNSETFLVCNIFDKPLNNVQFGTKVELTQGATKASGIVTDILENGNGEYKTFVYVIRPDENNGLMDVGNVKIDCSFNVYSRQDVVVVPSKAIKKVGDRTFVNLLIDGVKIDQDVETGIVDGDMTEITGGLSGGEELILN